MVRLSMGYFVEFQTTNVLVGHEHYEGRRRGVLVGHEHYGGDGVACSWVTSTTGGDGVAAQGSRAVSSIALMSG